MIKNNTQLKITREQLSRFQEALGKLEESETLKKNPLLWNVQKEALESVIEELQEELTVYEKREKEHGES